MQQNYLRKSLSHEFRRLPVKRFHLILPSSMIRQISSFENKGLFNSNVGHLGSSINSLQLECDH